MKVEIVIKVGDKEYPMTQRNFDAYREYKQTKDKKVLDKLSDVVLDFGEEDSL